MPLQCSLMPALPALRPCSTELARHPACLLISLPLLPAAPGSSTGADLALAARPRYHIAGGKGVFFARPPYLNADLGAGAHATRFISLAEVRALPALFLNLCFFWHRWRWGHCLVFFPLNVFSLPVPSYLGTASGGLTRG